jgi:hypothetical protein
MKYRKCSQDDLIKALEIINVKYQGNIEFKTFDTATKNFTLKTKNSKLPGHRLHKRIESPFDNPKNIQRRGISACWHVHGDFFDALFSISPDAYIISNGNKITSNYGNWQDRNIGSQMFPQYYSESCECN